MGLVVTSLRCSHGEPGGGEPAAVKHYSKLAVVLNALACYAVITTPNFVWQLV